MPSNGRCGRGRAGIQCARSAPLPDSDGRAIARSASELRLVLAVVLMMTAGAGQMPDGLGKSVRVHAAAQTRTLLDVAGPAAWRPPSTEITTGPPPHPGQVLHRCLVSRAMTQTELANKLGVPARTINRLVRGHCGVSIDMAIGLTRPSSQILTSSGAITRDDLEDFHQRLLGVLHG